MARSVLPSDVKLALYVAGVMTAIGLMVEALGPVVVPLVYLCVAFAMSRIPLRYSLFTLMFLALTLENPAEGPACGYWQSPLYPVGALLLNHMNAYTGIKPLVFSGMDLCLGTLGVIALSRRKSKRNPDAPGRVETPVPLIKLAQLAFLGVAFSLLVGILRGGLFNYALWQVDRIVYLPLVFLLCAAGLRGPQDHITLLKILMSAVVVRSIAAFLIIRLVHDPDPAMAMAKLPYATSHHDSMLFAAGAAAMAALVLEGVGKHYVRTALFFMAIICIGIISNGRRLAWVQVGMTSIALYLISTDNPAKRMLRKLMIASTPLGLLYIALGWNSGSSIFKPVRSIRTAMDPSTDPSTMWRELENYNIILTLRRSPVFGVGFGNGYEEIITMPTVPYELEHYVPHNSILGFWTYTGPIGWSALTLLWAVGVFFAMRGYHASKDASWRAAGLMAAMSVLIYLIQCWGDMGLGTWTGVYLVAPALAIGGKLAVATGAWPVKRKPGAHSGVAQSNQPSVGQAA